MDVRTLCLGVLSRGAKSGYEIKKSCEEGPFAHFFDAGFGSIYPALRRLDADGLVVGAPCPQTSRPDKIVYHLTEAGHKTLVASLCEPPGADRIRSDFTFILMFAHLVPADLVENLIDRRTTWYRTHIARMEACEAECLDRPDHPPGDLFTLRWGLTVYRASLAYLESNRAWLLTHMRARPTDAE